MKTSGSRKWSARRIRSPSRAPCVNGLEGSTEIRKPLFGKLGAVGFFDFGNVSGDSLTLPTSNLLYAAGPGFRYLTPVGPARIDFGYQLKQEPGLRVNGNAEPRHWRIHFSIGQAF